MRVMVVYVQFGPGSGWEWAQRCPAASSATSRVTAARAAATRTSAGSTSTHALAQYKSI